MRSVTASSSQLSPDRFTTPAVTLTTALEATLRAGLAAVVIGVALPGWGQSPPPANSITTSAISVSPNTGTSTLDQLRPARGDGIDLQFPSGFSCRIASGDVPSLIIYGDQGALGSQNFTLATGSRAGMAFVAPLYRSRRAMCDQSMQLQNAMSQLEIAEKLVTTGAMSNEEFMELSRRIKAVIFAK